MSRTDKKDIVLALETTQSVGSISLLEGKREICSIIIEKEVSKSVFLLELVESILLKCRIDAERIGLIVVSDGPGSLTGLRIGKSVAKGLSDAFGIDYRAIGLLSAMRFNGSVFFDKELSAVPVGRDRIAYQVFKRNILQKEDFELKFCFVSEFAMVLQTFLKSGGMRILIPENLRMTAEESIKIEDSKFLSICGNLAKLIGLTI